MSPASTILASSAFFSSIWVSAIGVCGMRRDRELSYAESVHRDSAALRAVLASPWLTGRVKGIQPCEDLEAPDVWPGRNATCSSRRLLLPPGRPSRLNRLSLRSTMPLNQFRASFIRLPPTETHGCSPAPGAFQGNRPSHLAFWEGVRLTSSRDSPLIVLTEKCVDHPCHVLRLRANGSSQG